MTLADVLARLEGVRATHGYHLARCPAHQDRTPSLSIREGEDGRILIHDFGGCPTGKVLSALGLKFADLFPASKARSVPKNNAASIRQ